MKPVIALVLVLAVLIVGCARAAERDNPGSTRTPEKKQPSTYGNYIGFRRSGAAADRPGGRPQRRSTRIRDTALEERGQEIAGGVAIEPNASGLVARPFQSTPEDWRLVA